MWALLWNNPKLHTPDRRKSWLACDEHRESLCEFLGARGFLRDVEPVEAADAPRRVDAQVGQNPQFGRPDCPILVSPIPIRRTPWPDALLRCWHRAAAGSTWACSRWVWSWSSMPLSRSSPDDGTLPGLALLSIPLIVVIAKFPMVLDSGDGGIEVGFDSSILMFLLCTLPPDQALVVWSLGVLVTQITSDKRADGEALQRRRRHHRRRRVRVRAQRHPRRRAAIGEPIELLAVAVAAAAYFATDFVLSAISVAIETKTPLSGHLVQRGTLVAIACFVPFDLLGYLGAVVARDTPWWTLILLGVPLATLLVATRSVTRGAENARRLGVLFDAAVRAQTLSDTRQVVDALVDDAQRLLRIQSDRGARRPRRAPTRSGPSCATASATAGSSHRPGTAPAPPRPPTSRPSRRWSRSPPTRSHGCG